MVWIRAILLVPSSVATSRATVYASPELSITHLASTPTFSPRASSAFTAAAASAAY